MLDFFSTDLKALDPDVHKLIGFEAERQARKIILIPSESQAPEAVREALGSVFQNIYAEGYPNPDTHGLSQSQILDYEVQLARYRRFGDERYYKGVEYADVVEALAASGRPRHSPPTAWALPTSGRTCSRSPAPRPTAPSTRPSCPSAPPSWAWTSSTAAT